MEFNLKACMFSWFSLATLVTGSSSSLGLNSRHGPAINLRAITSRSSLLEREDRLLPRHDHEHLYADHDSINNGESSRFAKTATTYKLPTLALEDFEMDVDEIQCDESMITVQFSSVHTLQESRTGWDSLEEFFIISSHPGCNDDGERLPYLVSKTTYSSNEYTVEFSVKPLELKDAWNSVNVAFGMAEYSPDVLRSHEQLQKRQALAIRSREEVHKRQGSVYNTSSTVQAPATSVVFPTPPSTTPTGTSSTGSISFSTPPNDTIVDLDISESGMSANLTITCIECSIEGKVEVTEGTFIITSSNFSLIEDVDEIENFIESGYFLAKFTGVGAHIDLATSLDISAKNQSFNEELSTIPLIGFHIPGVATVGSFFRTSFKGTLDVEASLDFTAGFELSLPDNADILITIGNLTNSSTTGFDQATISALPFSASGEIALDLGIGLFAELLFGISVAGGDGEVDAGGFIDLPYLSVSIVQVTDVDSTCSPASPSDSSTYSNLTHFTAEAVMDVGLEANLDIDIDILDVVGYTRDSAETKTLAATTIILPTACMSWDGSKNSYQTLTAKSKKGSSGSNSSSSGAESVYGNAGFAWGGLFIVSFFAVACL